MREENIAWATDLLGMSSCISYLESVKNAPETIREAALVTASNAVEDFYAQSETEFSPFLEAMRNGDLSFAQGDANNLPRFFHFIAQQQGRTKNTEERVLRAWSCTGPAAGLRIKDPRAAFSILRHVFANSVGFYLYAARYDLRFVLYKASANDRFLTTDQPVINLVATEDDFTPPESLDLFYSISPTYALRISPIGAVGTFNERIADTDVRYFNRRLLEHSRALVISSSREQLEAGEN